MGYPGVEVAGRQGIEPCRAGFGVRTASKAAACKGVWSRGARNRTGTSRLSGEGSTLELHPVVPRRDQDVRRDVLRPARGPRRGARHGTGQCRGAAESSSSSSCPPLLSWRNDARKKPFLTTRPGRCGVSPQVPLGGCQTIFPGDESPRRAWAASSKTLARVGSAGRCASKSAASSGWPRCLSKTAD